MKTTENQGEHPIPIPRGVVYAGGTMNNTLISQAASLLKVSTDAVVSNYRDVAFALACEFNWNNTNLIKFIRECLIFRNPDIKGRNQYLLAVDILRDEGIRGI